MQLSGFLSGVAMVGPIGPTIRDQHNHIILPPEVSNELIVTARAGSSLDSSRVVNFRRHAWEEGLNVVDRFASQGEKKQNR